jgi:hypothetical protein
MTADIDPLVVVQTASTNLVVIAELDPAIHQKKNLARVMDARVKPGHDECFLRP